LKIHGCGFHDCRGSSHGNHHAFPEAVFGYIGKKTDLQSEARSQRCQPHENDVAATRKIPGFFLHQSEVTTDPGRMLSKNHPFPPIAHHR
jgi:hypothetical protein